MLFDLLSDLIKIDDILLIVKNDSAISEIRSNFLSIRQKEKWITVGDNDGPAHMHINSDSIKSVEFVEEKNLNVLALVYNFLIYITSVF